MSMYTTGELAKLCGVSVRTVQYYDSRGILVPSELTEGGRRLYSAEDLKRLRIICFLREAGLPINSIAELFAEPKPEQVISILLDQQEQVLQEELQQRQTQLALIAGIKRELKEIDNFSVESIRDIAQIMKHKNKLWRTRLVLLLIGLPLGVFQWISIVLWITNGLWQLFILWLALALIFSPWASIYYYRRIKYICPACHEVFKPTFKKMFWAKHTPRMRRLTCPNCGATHLCVEVYDEPGGRHEKM